MKKPSRTKKLYTISFDQDLIEDLDEWIKAQQFKSPRNEVISSLVRQHLRKEGWQHYAKQRRKK